MNFAFPAALFLVLILPGIVFRYSYLRGSWGRHSPTSFRSVSDELAYAIFLSAFLHLVWVVGASSIGYGVDLTAILWLLSGALENDAVRLAAVSKSVDQHPVLIWAYFVSIFVGAAWLGWVGHQAIRFLGLDRSYRFFRFDNEWYYLLTGEVLQFAENEPLQREVDGTFLTGVVDHGSESYLYSGIVDAFSFNRQGELDRIQLRRAARRRLATTGADDRRLQTSVGAGDPYVGSEEIQSDYVVVRYSDMKTLALDYFVIEVIVESTETPAASPEEASLEMASQI